MAPYSPGYNVPLLSMDANPNTGVWIYDSFQSNAPPPPLVPDPANPGWSVVGGTSLACPMMAAYFSTIQQGLTLEGLGTLSTATAFNDIMIAGEANPFYFTKVPGATGVAGYPLLTPPPTPTGTLGSTSRPAIPNDNHTGFGEPVTNGSGIVGLGGQVTFSVPEQATDGLTDLFMSNDVFDFPAVPDQGFEYLLTYTGKMGKNEPLDLQNLGMPSIRSYFPAPSTHQVIDSIYDTNAELTAEALLTTPILPDHVQFETSTDPSGGLPVVNSIAGQAIGGASGFNVDVRTFTVSGVGGPIDTSYQGTVTLTLTSAALAGLTVGGSNLPFGAGSVISVNAVNGVATFSDVIIDQAGIGYILTANAAGATPSGITPGGYFSVNSASSVQFTVSPAAVSQLAITTQPISTFQFSDVPVVISLEDVFGNVINTDNYSVVDLSASGPSPFDTRVFGTASGGVVGFNLEFGVPGTYTLLVSDVFEGFPSVITSAFTITAAQTQSRGLNGIIISSPVLNGQQERNGPIQARG